MLIAATSLLVATSASAQVGLTIAGRLGYGNWWPWSRRI